jgi:asparagine synthase (glutamine-hydrolysing)
VTVLAAGRVTATNGGDHGASAAHRIALAYQAGARQGLARLDGSYAFALFDWRAGELLLGADPLGIERAYLYRRHPVIAFSDRLGEILRHADTEPDLDGDSLRDFLVLGWVPAPYSMLRQVAKLPPGGLYRHGPAAADLGEYVDLPEPAGPPPPRGAELLAVIRDGLDQAVCRGLPGVASWGAFLSGGMDSSSVVASLAGVTGSGFPTYFGAFRADINRYLIIPDEAPLARRVAERYGSEHRELALAEDAIHTMPEVVAALEEPVCDGGCIVVDAVLRRARHEVGGVLTGVGGDFLFGGERRHLLHGLFRRMRAVPEALWRLAPQISGTLARLGHPRLAQLHFDLQRLLRLRGEPLDRLYLRVLEGEEVPLDALLAAPVRAALTREPGERIAACLARVADWDPLAAMLYLDLKLVIPSHCVREVQTLGRHHGVVTYSPYLDLAYLRTALGIPSAVKVRGLRLKAAMKQAMRPRLPAEVLGRRKGGLGAPVRWWVTRPDGPVAQALAPDAVGRRGLVEPRVVQALREATRAGRRDHSKLLWSLYTLELWLQWRAAQRRNP